MKKKNRMLFLRWVHANNASKEQSISFCNDTDTEFFTFEFDEMSIEQLIECRDELLIASRFAEQKIKEKQENKEKGDTE